MSFIKTVVLSLSLFLILTGCGQNESSEAKESAPKAEEVDPDVAKKYAEMMADHDVTMTKMQAMYNLKQELKKKKAMVDSTEQNRSKKLIMKQREQIDEAVKKLDEADKAMMSWMRNIPAVDEMPESEALETIEEEHQKIKQVDSDINEAIADASEILKKQ